MQNCHAIIRPVAAALAAATCLMVIGPGCGGGERQPAGTERAVAADAATGAGPATKPPADAAIDGAAASPWHCFRDRSQRVGLCFPGLQLCDVARDSYRWNVGRKASPGPCAPLPEVYCAVIGAGRASCAPAREDCTVVRDTYVAAGATVGSCTPTKVWEPAWQDLAQVERELRQRPPRDSLRPRGAGWYCADVVGAWASATDPRRSKCFRKAAECRSFRGEMGGSGCDGKVATAVCFTASDGYLCARDSSGCDHLRSMALDDVDEMLSDCGEWR